MNSKAHLASKWIMPHPSKQEIACTRSFGYLVTELHHLAEAVTDFGSRAAVKVRKQGSLAGQVLVFIRTSPFCQDLQYSRSITVPLRRPSADTGVLVNAALSGLARIFKADIIYAKAGVMLLSLQPDTQNQTELALEDDGSDLERGKLMTSLDELNGRFGRRDCSVGSRWIGCGTARLFDEAGADDSVLHDRWEDMPVARA